MWKVTIPTGVSIVRVPIALVLPIPKVILRGFLDELSKAAIESMVFW
jgi:hypothetical protein